MGERQQRRLGAARVGVVAVVDQERAVRQPHGPHPASRRGGVCEPAQDEVCGEPDRNADCRRRGGVVAVVRSDQLQLRHPAGAAELHFDAQAGPAVVSGDQADVAAEGCPEGHQPPPRQPGLRQHARIVGVRHCRGPVAQGMEQLALGVRHALEGTAAFQMHRPDVRDQAHVGVHPLCKPRDLAEVVHPALDGGVAVLLAEPQQREGHADFVVQVALRLERRPGGGENFRHQLLGARLSRRARDADHFQGGEPAPPCRGEVAEGAPGVGSRQHRGRPCLRSRLLQRIRRNQDPGSAALHRLRHEVAAVEVLSAQRDEERPRHRLSRIGERALERTSRDGDARAGCPGGLFRRESRSAHREISSSARRASMRSSKGRFSLPTI